MELYLDTANLAQIKEMVELGVISGVTTNPTLVAAEKNANYEKVIKEICVVVSGPVSVEVTEEDAVSMERQAIEFSKWSSNIVVKMPITYNGLRAMHSATKQGAKINATLCFSINQALLAVKAGATYVSPFVGRLDDIGQNGMALVYDLVNIFEHYGFGTKVIAASIRHPMHVEQAAKLGAHIATVPYAILKQMIQHPLTDSGLAKFLSDWRDVANKK